MNTKLLTDLVAMMDVAERRRGMTSMPPLPPEEVDALQKRAMLRLGHPLPDAYIAFLKLTDGACISSLSIPGSRERPLRYANGREHKSAFIRDVIEDIEEFKVNILNDADLFVLMENDVLRGWDPVKRGCFLLGSQGEPFRTYRNFEEMLADALWEVSIDTRPLMPTDFAFFSTDRNGKTVHGLKSRA